MAEVYDKKSPPMWVWIVGAIIALIVIFLIWNWMRPIAPVVTSPPMVTAPAPAPAPAASTAPATTAVAPVALIVAVPADYFDRDVSGTARVADVPTDRGFYLEENGRRMLAILGKDFTEKQVNVNAGQMVRVSGVVRASSKLDEAEVGSLQPATRDLITKEPVYLVVKQVEILARP
ncbi:MAG: hypothetical protein SGJ07_17440 [Rhodospirillaceae bacterium]|nr:hypothetical protein [Rhodospirillaceae bacterium]